MKKYFCDICKKEIEHYNSAEHSRTIETRGNIAYFDADDRCMKRLEQLVINIKDCIEYGGIERIEHAIENLMTLLNVKK